MPPNNPVHVQQNSFVLYTIYIQSQGRESTATEVAAANIYNTVVVCNFIDQTTETNYRGFLALVSYVCVHNVQKDKDSEM